MRAGSSSNTWICLMVSSPQSSQRSGTIKKKRQMSHLTFSLQIPHLSQELPSVVIFNHLSLITTYNRHLWSKEMTSPLFLYHFITLPWVVIGFNSLIPLNSERYGGESHLKISHIGISWGRDLSYYITLPSLLEIETHHCIQEGSFILYLRV